MTFRWLICFSLAAAEPLVAAVVSGRVELQDSKEKAVNRGHDYSDVAVWLEMAGGRAPQAATQSRAVMVQKGKKFLPHLLTIRAGTAVDFPNQDPIFHNAFSNFSGQIFDIGLYRPGGSRTVVFSRPGVVRVFCNIHSAMSALIVVVDTPWFGVTEADGSFRITGVPPGDYRLRVFHERASSAQLAKSERSLTIGSGEVAPIELKISESGFLPAAPHPDKHGNPYRRGSDDYKVLR